MGWIKSVWNWAMDAAESEGPGILLIIFGPVILLALAVAAGILWLVGGFG